MRILGAVYTFGGKIKKF